MDTRYFHICFQRKPRRMHFAHMENRRDSWNAWVALIPLVALHIRIPKWANMR